MRLGFVPASFSGGTLAEALAFAAGAGFDGDVAIEVEVRASEGSLAKRHWSLFIARSHPLRFLAG